MNASPYLTFGQLASSSAILEAFVGESHVHVIDFGMGFGIQWQAFIQALAARAGGPPHLRITGVDICSPNKFKRAHCLVETGRRLTVSRLPLRSPSRRRQRGRGSRRGRAVRQGNMEEGDSEGEGMHHSLVRCSRELPIEKSWSGRWRSEHTASSQTLQTSAEFKQRYGAISYVNCTSVFSEGH